MVFRFLLATVTCGMSANGGAICSKPSIFRRSKIRPSDDEFISGRFGRFGPLLRMAVGYGS